MPQVKRYAMAGGTFAAILAIGFVMQGGSSRQDQPVMMSAAVPESGADAAAPVEISAITLTSASLDSPKDAAMPALPGAPVTEAALQDAPVVVPLPRETPTPAFGCEISMTAEPIAAALVNLTLSAPCLRNERLTLHHNGMMFTEATDDKGHLELAVPALSETAVFIASFANGQGAVASATVDSLAFYDRAVVQSEAVSAATIHALEYGAGYDDAGHVWTDAAGAVQDAATGKGGFLMSLGAADMDKALVAQVYSFPVGIAARDGDVALSVEIEVTAQNCGKDIEAQTLQTDEGGKLVVQSLDLTMPDCDAVGDFLVLKNLVNDLKVARN